MQWLSQRAKEQTTPVSAVVQQYSTLTQRSCVQNDELCSVCSSKRDSDKLLCCELCPRVYHLYCLKPPLKKVPDGDWYCSHCQKSLSLDNIEKFLAARTRAVVS